MADTKPAQVVTEPTNAQEAAAKKAAAEKATDEKCQENQNSRDILREGLEGSRQYSRTIPRRVFPFLGFLTHLDSL